MDRVRLDESAPEQTTVTKLDAARADLAHRGRATIFRPTMLTRQDALDDESPDDPVQVGYGAFTRYGDVRELLTALDDRYVVLRHGDQITLAFPGTPAPAAGTVRSVVLQVDVSMKTFFYGPMVEPLPFHGMSAYPYPPTEAYPNDAVHQQFLVDYQTRVYPLPSH
jgi:hypothetical protein